MSLDPNDETWRDRERFNNTEKFSYKDLTGREIFCDPSREVSCMSSYFLSRWQQVNETSEVLLSNKTALTSVKLGGRTYPAFFQLSEDFAPLTLGKDFFSANKWEMGEDNCIDTPYGKIVTSETPLGKLIDTDLAEKVFTAEKVQKRRVTG